MEIRKKERDSAVVDIKTLQKRRLFLGGPIWKELYTMYTLWCSSMVVLFSAFFFDYKEFLANEGTVGGLFYCQQFISSAASLFVWGTKLLMELFPNLRSTEASKRKLLWESQNSEEPTLNFWAGNFQTKPYQTTYLVYHSGSFFLNPKKCPQVFDKL